jgi:uncharacterized protein YdaL
VTRTRVVIVMAWALAAVSAVCPGWAGTPKAAATPTSSVNDRGWKKHALILYDGTSTHDREGIIGASHIANLLGHFEFTGTEVPVESYKPGEMSRYDAVFVVAGMEEKPLPATVVKDARTTKATVVWLGYQLQRLLPAEDLAKRGVIVQGYLHESKFRKVKYKDVVLGKGTGDLARMTIADGSGATVVATAVDPAGNEAPYIVHTGNLWLVGDGPFAYVDEQDRYIVFCDLLHDMLGVPHAVEHRALVRLEDINPEDDPALIRRAVDVFVSEGVPFQIALVPLYRDPATNLDVSLSDRPEVVAAVEDAVHRGASIVMHGVTHQFNGTTPDDYEFWDDLRNQKRPDDSVELVRNKLENGLDECFRNDLYPLAWETPHYAASTLDYGQIAQVFATINERPLTIEQQGTQQFFPYPTIDVRGTLVVPENVGYLPLAHQDPEIILTAARAELAVRDSIASMYVHDFVDPHAIRAAIAGVKALGYTFVSLRDFPCRVSTGSRLIETAGMTGTLTFQQEYLRQFILATDGGHEKESYSSSRLSGEKAPDLVPGPGQVVVAQSTEDLPAAAPGVMGRMQGWAKRGWATVRRHSPLPPVSVKPLAVALVWDPAAKGEARNDQESFRAAFTAYGIEPRLIARGDLVSTTLTVGEVLVVPQASARVLNDAELAAAARFVRQGGGVILDGRSALAESLGVLYGDRTTSAGSIRDPLAGEAELHWRPIAAVHEFRLPPSKTVLATNTGTETPVVASFHAGSGQVLYLAATFDPFTTDGTSRFPFLFEHALDTFDRDLSTHRASIELYFDPGLRPGVSVEHLGPMWRRLGVRVIYVGAWDFYANYTYDYERLLRVCHANGILVYAWFEFPQVSRLFWERHPEWREVPAKGTTLPSWRLAMNLANPACRAAVLQFMHDTLSRWPWDGVNLAEIGFDGIADGGMPEKFVPMNTELRTQFHAAQGFDPRDLFDPTSKHWWKDDAKGWSTWLGFRRDFVTQMNREFLEALRPVSESGREVIVTVIDSLEHPRTMTDNGIDSAAITALMHDFDFTLQVEDPAYAWAKSPHRYEKLAERYRPLVPAGRRFMFDLNVVNERNVEPTHLPLARAQGTELAATVQSARTAGDRVALYGDSTVRARDLELLAAAFASEAHVVSDGLTWTVDTHDAVEVAVPRGVHDFYLESSEWPYWRPGFVLIPPGHHVLSAYKPWFRLFDLSAMRPQVLQVNGGLESAHVEHGRLRFEYESEGRALTLLARRPQHAEIDSENGTEIVQDGEGPVALLLPKGKHGVDIAGSSQTALVLDFVSIISSSLIVSFGTVACVMLSALYAGIRVRRLFTRRPR